VSKLVYRDTLTLEAGNIRVEGGQGDYISLECSGVDKDSRRVAIPREGLEQVARMLVAMKGYLSNA
jgi:hypothetical protein